MATRIVVMPLSIDCWDAVSALFATSAGVNECWCIWPLRPRGSHSPDRKANRATMKALLESGRSPGLVALAAKRAVGWCAVGPRDTYPQYEPLIGGTDCWAIPCLYVDRAADRSEVARALIDAAIGLASESGATVLYGPPPYWLPGGPSEIAEATGTFLDNGFEQTGPGARMPELRFMVTDGDKAFHGESD